MDHLKINQRKLTPYQKRYIELSFAGSQTKKIAKWLDLPEKTVSYYAHLKGLKKDKAVLALNGYKVAKHPKAIANRFQKGSTPHNKGRKQSEYMTAESIEKTVKTRFQKGHISHNKKPIGSTRICTKNAYILVNVGGSRYVSKHRLVWQEHHGKIPKGSNIQFKDGNVQNCDINNLYIISRSEQLQVNHKHHTSDGMIAAYLIGGKRKKTPEEIAKMKQRKELIELKRNQLKLQREIEIQTNARRPSRNIPYKPKKQKTS